MGGFLESMGMPNLSSIFGSKPKVPALGQIDISDEQRKAIEQNQANLPEAEKLGGEVNRYNEEQLARMLGLSAADYQELKASTTGSIRDELKGQIPEDVLDTIQRQGAERGLFKGIGSAPASRSWTAADIGRTSLDLFHTGLSALERWTSSNASSMFNVTSMFVTPQQRLAFSTEERNLRFQHAWLKSQIKAMPDPTMRGIWDTIMNLANSYLGGTYSGTFNSSQAAGQAGAGVANAGSYPYGPNTPSGYGNQPNEYSAAAYGPPESTSSVGGNQGDFGAGFGMGAAGIG